MIKTEWYLSAMTCVCIYALMTAFSQKIYAAGDQLVLGSSISATVPHRQTSREYYRVDLIPSAIDDAEYFDPEASVFNVEVSEIILDESLDNRAMSLPSARKAHHADSSEQASGPLPSSALRAARSAAVPALNAIYRAGASTAAIGRVSRQITPVVKRAVNIRVPMIGISQ